MSMTVLKNTSKDAFEAAKTKRFIMQWRSNTETDDESIFLIRPTKMSCENDYFFSKQTSVKFIQNLIHDGEHQWSYQWRVTASAKSVRKDEALKQTENMIEKICVLLKSLNGRSDLWKGFYYNWSDICEMFSPLSLSVVLYTAFFCTTSSWNCESLIGFVPIAQRSLTYTKNSRNSSEPSRDTSWWTTKNWSWTRLSNEMTQTRLSQSARIQQKKKTECSWIKRHLSNSARLCVKAQSASALMIRQMSWSFHEYLTSDHRKQIIFDWHLKMKWKVLLNS